jgi:arylformamidase
MRQEDRMKYASSTISEAELDAEFSLGAILDLESVFARRTAASQAARASLRHHRQLRYGARPGETCDVFPSGRSQEAGGPVLIYIHGGFWRANDAATFSYVAEGFAPEGALVIIIDYDLMPAVGLRDIIDECETAVQWAYGHARQFGGNPNRIFVSGNSAGGHLAAMLADRRWPPNRNLPSDIVKGAIAVSGIYDLAPLTSTSMQEVFRFTSADIEAMSPLRLLPHEGAPLLLAVGEDETRAFRDETHKYAEACRSHGLTIQEMIVPNTNHITVVLDAFAKPGHELNQAILRMMALAEDA